ncbi:lysophospholipid acyltransferase family protein [Hydrogenovibrio kuenenii]|uniref:lysophospholipid acyltransferase family protein n=1 Tax=Hydrogenovibrio kuenenii TaxID=63658 RepID=UPI0004BB7790|nr:lysophospholipid acyltransferase family protein [Hydrogenovibrio kuenenii]
MAKYAKMDWQGRVFIGLLKFFSWFSLPINHRLGAGIGYLLWWLPESVSGAKRVTRINLQTAYPQLAPGDIQSLVKQHLIQLGKTATELGPLWLWEKGKVLSLIKQVSGQNVLDKAFAQKRGVIVICPHLGSWEIIGLYLSNRYETTNLYEPPNIVSLEGFIVDVRGRTGAKLAPTDRSGVMKLIRALKKNEVTGILPDQDPGEVGGVYAPFYGHPARTMTLVSKLTAKTGCELVYMSAERLPNGEGFHIHILPADKQAIAAQDDLTAATALNAGIEHLIEIVSTTQYHWNYKRYRHPPEGVKDIYKREP